MKVTRQDHAVENEMKRREFLQWAGGALAVAGALVLPGCGSSAASLMRKANEDDQLAQNKPGESYYDRLMRERASRNGNQAVPSNNPYPENEAATVLPSPSRGAVAAISRASWGAGAPVVSKMKAMGGGQRITIHHEGNPKPNTDVTAAQVAQTLRGIQKAHAARLGAGDIGYHYIIDRSGRIWEGRSIRYQGAHISKYNPHNAGIMLLGNFDLQYPTRSQLGTLQTLCSALAAGYGISPRHIYCHGELASTRCPGKNLRTYMNRIRGQIA